jgi:DNA-binding IclR family transcriptional regulator
MVDRQDGDAANGWGGAPPYGSRGWTLLTNHAHVLMCIRNDPSIRVRDIAYLVGITERAAHKIVGDLGEAGFVTRTKVGRRNQYTIHPDTPMRHPLERHQVVGELLAALCDRRSQDTTMAAQN